MYNSVSSLSRVGSGMLFSKLSLEARTLCPLKTRTRCALSTKGLTLMNNEFWWDDSLALKRLAALELKQSAMLIALPANHGHQFRPQFEWNTRNGGCSLEYMLLLGIYSEQFDGK